MHSVINVTACWQWYVLSFLYRRGEGLLVLYIQKLHSDVIFPILRSLKIPFLNYCKAITLHICIFPYVIVISSKKNIFPTSDIIFNTHIILAANDLSVSDDSFSRFFSGSCFRHVIGRDELQCLLLRVLALPAPML